MAGVQKVLRTGVFAAIGLFSAFAGVAEAQVPFSPPQPPRRVEKPKPLTLTPPPQPASKGRQLNGTAFFVDDAGNMLTVRHAVENCARVTVFKEGRYVAAKVVAIGSRFDLALIKVPRTLGLSAVFPRTAVASPNDMVFAGAYDNLPGLSMRGGVFANATVSASLGPAEAGHIVIDSPVTFGASGAPVLDRNGLVQGVISRRTMSNRVLAVGAMEAKAFLSSNGVRVDQDDRPQIAGTASRANRAASLSAKVTCLQN
jgi:S1-C subfamily serine protease